MESVEKSAFKKLAPIIRRQYEIGREADKMTAFYHSEDFRIELGMLRAYFNDLGIKYPRVETGGEKWDIWIRFLEQLAPISESGALEEARRLGSVGVQAGNGKSS